MEDMLEDIQAALPDSVSGGEIAFDELTIYAARKDIVKVLTHLRDEPSSKFTTLIDICGVDYPARDKRFDVVYHLLSMHHNHRIRVKVQADEEDLVPSVISVFPAADWYEREAFDMYGIGFEGHPDLRRLLTDYGFEGYPLRKDFPLTGFVEVRYDEAREAVVYEPVKLAQEYRSFDFMSPWEGAKYVLPGDEKSQEKA